MVISQPKGLGKAISQYHFLVNGSYGMVLLILKMQFAARDVARTCDLSSWEVGAQFKASHRHTASLGQAGVYVKTKPDQTKQ